MRLAPFRTLYSLLGPATLLGLLTACPRGDVGAPCNHGSVEPPKTKLVTFPALSCDDLLCVYAVEKEPPADPCTSDEDCNNVETIFTCDIAADEASGECKLKLNYVLDRSMCSKKCGSDSDCKDGGVGKKVVDKDTHCASGFACARIQQLGEFCCERLCVCKDDLELATSQELDTQCGNQTLSGCCDKMPVPEACKA